MKKIAIFQADLKVGGIQRSLINLLSSHILDNYQVDVYLFSREVFYEINGLKENIHIYFLKPFPYWFRFIPVALLMHMSFYKEIKESYDYAFDYDSYRQECAYCVTRIKQAKKFLWIHSDIEKELHYKKKYRVLYIFFKRKYQFYDEFVAVSDGVVEPFRKYSGNPCVKITVIPNIINTEQILEKSQEHTEVIVNPDKCNVVCVGKVCVQKGYDFLLQDIYTAYKKRKDICCYIIGDGPDLKSYQKWVMKHNLSDVIFFLGNQKNPFPIVKQMDAFCFESRFEGQGMVLWEAKCLGLQLIFPKRLEKYNIHLKGVEDISEALINLKKMENKTYDSLNEYHNYIEMQYRKLLRN